MKKSDHTHIDCSCHPHLAAPDETNVNTPVLGSEGVFAGMNRAERRRYNHGLRQHNRAEKKRLSEKATRIKSKINPYEQPGAADAVERALADALSKLEPEK